MEKGLNELKDSMNKLISSENNFVQALQDRRNPEVVIGSGETTMEGLVVGAGQGFLANDVAQPQSWSQVASNRKNPNENTSSSSRSDYPK